MLLTSVVLFLATFCGDVGSTDPDPPTSQPRVAIVGGGIGGSAAARLIRKKFPKAEIAVFEAEDRIGGRLNEFIIAGRRYECGGTIIHEKNQEMQRLVEELGLEHREVADFIGELKLSQFSLHDDGQVLFKTSTWGIVTTMKLIWRYGLVSLWNLYAFIATSLSEFANIYPLLDSGEGFSTVSDLLSQMSPSILQEITESGEQTLLSQGVDELVIEELGGAALRCNYGQTAGTMHGFVSAVGLAGFDGDLFAVRNGNSQVAKRCIEESGAKVYLNTSITSIEFSEGTFGLGLEIGDRQDTFDVVILATPMTKDKTSIKLVGIPFDPVFPDRFHRTVATFVDGTINPDFLGGMPITATNFYINGASNINSIALQTPTDYSKDEGGKLPHVWKIFSQLPLEESSLREIFTDIRETRVFDWLAYPHYSPGREMGNFTLYKGLYHINAIEWAASAMEMSVIGAKNVANLAYNDWNEQRMDQRIRRNPKTEL